MPRAFQQRFVERDLPDAWSKKYRNVILALPPGAGKTRCARMTIERLLCVGGWDAWFLAHRVELIEQAATELRHLSPSLYVAGRPSPQPAPLRVAGRDTLARRDFRSLADRCLLVSDEHHHGTCETFTKLLSRFQSVYRVVYVLGLTATPYTLSGKPIPGDVIIEPVKPTELFADGTILEPEVKGLDAPDTSRIPMARGEFVATELEQRTRKLVGNMVDEAKRFWEGYPFTVRAVSVADAHHRAERLCAAGFRAAVLHGELPPAERDLILARLAIGGALGSPLGLDCVVRAGNPDIIGEGWNNPSDYERVLRLRSILWPSGNPPPFVPVSTLSDCAPTMSECLYRQAECRVNRPNGNTIQTTLGPMPAVPKKFARVLSHSENWRRFVPLRDHHTFTLDGETPSGRAPRDKHGFLSCRYCPRCLSVWPSSQASCSCGAALAQVKPPPEETADRLGDVGERPKSKVAASTPQARIEILANLWRSLARKQGRVSERQVYAVFRSMTGQGADPSEMEQAKRKM